MVPPESIILAVWRMDLQITYFLLILGGRNVTDDMHLQQGEIFVERDKIH